MQLIPEELDELDTFDKSEVVMVPYKLVKEITKYPRIGELKTVLEKLRLSSKEINNGYLIDKNKLIKAVVSYSATMTFYKLQDNILGIETINVPGMVLNKSFFKQFYK